MSDSKYLSNTGYANPEKNGLKKIRSDSGMNTRIDKGLDFSSSMI